MAGPVFFVHILRMDFFIYVRIVFGILFIGTLVGGYFLFKHMDRLLAHPYENAGASGLNKAQIIVIWLHAVALTGGFAFLLN
jgi:hypothetical protein